MKRALVLLALLAPPVRGDAPELLASGASGSVRLRLEVTVDGKPAEAAWEAFLDRLFDYLDRDGDGSLSPSEASRIFPLPLPGRREVVMDFARLDADRDGKGSRAEFKEFYRRAGFTPVVVVALPPPAEALRLGEALFRCLDRDGDGKLSRKELADAPALLQRLDEDEDERLTPAEVLALHADKGPPPAAKASVRPAEPDAKAPPDAVLRLAVGRGAPAPKLTAVRGKGIGELAPGRLRLPDAVWTADDGAGGAADLPAARAFLLAQFDNLRGDRPSVARDQIMEDAAAQALAGLFDHADRDGDGKLTRAELDDFLGLVEQGAQCQAVVTVADRGRNLFDALDENRDGRLDLRELKRAARLLAGDRDFLGAEEVPRQVVFGVSRGLTADAFGPVPLARKARRPERPPAPAVRGPRWFRAMDRNGDGFLSPREFLGPPEAFRRLDADGDGLISAEEAERAERAERR